jgi:hypothetical protein
MYQKLILEKKLQMRKLDGSRVGWAGIIAHAVLLQHTEWAR